MIAGDEDDLGDDVGRGDQRHRRDDAGTTCHVPDRAVVSDRSCDVDDGSVLWSAVDFVSPIAIPVPSSPRGGELRLHLGERKLLVAAVWLVEDVIEPVAPRPDPSGESQQPELLRTSEQADPHRLDPYLVGVEHHAQGDTGVDALLGRGRSWHEVPPAADPERSDAAGVDLGRVSR